MEHSRARVCAEVRTSGRGARGIPDPKPRPTTLDADADSGPGGPTQPQAHPPGLAPGVWAGCSPPCPPLCASSPSPRTPSRPHSLNPPGCLCGLPPTPPAFQVGQVMIPLHWTGLGPSGNTGIQDRAQLRPQEAAFHHPLCLPSSAPSQGLTWVPRTHQVGLTPQALAHATPPILESPPSPSSTFLSHPCSSLPSGPSLLPLPWSPWVPRLGRWRGSGARTLTFSIVPGTWEVLHHCLGNEK